MMRAEGRARRPQPGLLGSRVAARGKPVPCLACKGCCEIAWGRLASLRWVMNNALAPCAVLPAVSPSRCGGNGYGLAAYPTMRGQLGLSLRLCKCEVVAVGAMSSGTLEQHLPAALLHAADCY